MRSTAGASACLLSSSFLRASDALGCSEDMSSYLSRKSEAYVVEQSFIFLHDITAMAPTSTRFGVTSKDIIGKALPLTAELGD
jgi:hypothetical protein